jgi:hypothetical protein
MACEAALTSSGAPTESWVTHEETIRIGLRPEMVHVISKCFAQPWHQRHGSRAVRLDSWHVEAALDPRDITQLEQHDLADAQPQIDHAQRHGVVASAFSLATIEGTEKGGALLVTENLRRA